MSRNVDVRAKCPFFQEEASCAGLTPRAKIAHEYLKKCRIRCEGLRPGGKIFLEFEDPRERDEHYENFCVSECWRGCPLAQMLETK